MRRVPISWGPVSQIFVNLTVPFAETDVSVEGGESIQTDAKYLVIMRRQADGSWKLTRYIWNLTTPPEE